MGSPGRRGSVNSNERRSSIGYGETFLSSPKNANGNGSGFEEEVNLLSVKSPRTSDVPEIKIGGKLEQADYVILPSKAD